MSTLDSTAVAVLDNQQGLAELPDFTTDAYKDAYSRINAIVIEGEQEAHDNYLSLGTLIPDQAEELARLAKMEMKHMKGFTACAKNLGVVADMPFAHEFFAPLHGNFQSALERREGGYLSAYSGLVDRGIRYLCLSHLYPCR